MLNFMEVGIDMMVLGNPYPISVSCNCLRCTNICRLRWLKMLLQNIHEKVMIAVLSNLTIKIFQTFFTPVRELSSRIHSVHIWFVSFLQHGVVPTKTRRSVQIPDGRSSNLKETREKTIEVFGNKIWFVFF